MTIDKQREDECKISNFIVNKYLSKNTNNITISAKDLNSIGVNEKDASRIILTWQSDGLLQITNTGTLDYSFNQFWKIEVKSNALVYFERNKAID